MMCLLEIGMLILGISLLKKREIRVGSQVAPYPTPLFVAIPLILQLPMVMVIGFVIGVNEGMQAAKIGKSPEVATKEFQEKYWWLDIAIPTAGAAIAGVVLAFGLKDPHEIRQSEDDLLELQLAQDREAPPPIPRSSRRSREDDDDDRRRHRAEDDEPPPRAKRTRREHAEHDFDTPPPPPTPPARRKRDGDDVDVWKFKS